MSLKAKVLVHTLCIAAVLGLATVAMAVNGAASLFVAGATHTPTHWNMQPGATVIATLVGVDPSEVGGTLPATLDVWVKSSYWGNTYLVATRIDATADYTFTYTAPAIASGDPLDACGTTIVAYAVLGRNANNDYCDDDMKNGTWFAASGFRFVNAFGMPLECTVPVQPSPWGAVKGLFR